MKFRSMLLFVAISLAATSLNAQKKVFFYSPNPNGGLHMAVLENDTWNDLGQRVLPTMAHGVLRRRCTIPRFVVPTTALGDWFFN